MAVPAVASQPALVELAGGEFLMGSDGHRPDERPAHLVHLGSFRAAERPVSNREYRLFVEATGAPAPRFWDQSDFGAPAQPVVGVSWLDAIAYADWLSGATELALRLPSEAEREFAARGGQEGAAWPWGDADPAALAAVWRRLLDDGEERRRLGEAARRRAETAFASARAAERMERLYAAALGGRVNRRS